MEENVGQPVAAPSPLPRVPPSVGSQALHPPSLSQPPRDEFRREGEIGSQADCGWYYEMRPARVLPSVEDHSKCGR